MKSIGVAAIAAAIGVTLSCGAPSEATVAEEIVHDAEHYVLKAQHGTKWAKEDKAIQKKIADLKKKHGRPPNIIHIMWDDTAVGELGVPQNQMNRGFKTPNINKFADEGQYYSRMYTEPSCTPSRAAFQTGRFAVRSGMYNVSFPYEYGGMSEKRPQLLKYSVMRVTQQHSLVKATLET